MKIHFEGAARTVTGSQHLLDVNGSRVLLDCGLFQGRRRESYERNKNFPFDPASLDAVVLSHAHIDHSGNLPNLVASGFRGPIYATAATAHLANMMLLDSGYIQEGDAAYVNKKRARDGEPPIEPLYTIEDAGRVAQYFQVVEYGQVFAPAPGVAARLVEAGHILGSAAVQLDVEEDGREYRLWYSGDIGRRDLPLLRDPVLPEGVDYLIMECTYGDKPHRNIEDAYEEFEEVVRRTLKRGGKVIIPAFAVGRTQELVYSLHRLMVGNDIPSVPVYVDSPLAVNASNIFRQHTECYDRETRELVAQGKHREALGFDRLTYVRSAEESKSLNDKNGPMVIISASGMAEHGRILHHLAHNIGDPRNTIVIVSWQAPNTLGRRLADREEVVPIFGKPFNRRAEVATIGGLSAHGGQAFLLEYALNTRETLKHIFMVHGEQQPFEALNQKLHEAGIESVSFPERGQTVTI